MHNQPREPQPYEDCQEKSIQIWVNFTRNGLRLGSRHQESPHTDVKEFSYSYRQRRLTWAKEKKNWTVAQWSKVYFSERASFVFHLETKVLESGGRVEKICDDLGCNVFCWCWSIVFFENQRHCTVYQEILEHFMLPSADQLFKDADFIFQQDLTPVHTAKSTKSWLNDHDVTVLDWPANSDLNPIENMWGIVKRKMRNKRPKMQMSWRPLSKKPGLPDHLSSATNWSPPCHAELRQ